MLPAFARVIHASCSFQTSPPPAIAASLAVTTGLEKHRCEHVLVQVSALGFLRFQHHFRHMLAGRSRVGGCRVWLAWVYRVHSVFLAEEVYLNWSVKTTASFVLECPLSWTKPNLSNSGYEDKLNQTETAAVKSRWCSVFIRCVHSAVSNVNYEMSRRTAGSGLSF